MGSKMVGATKESRRGKRRQMHNNESAGDQMLSRRKKKRENYGSELLRDDTSGDVGKLIKMQNRAHLVDRSSPICPHVFPQTSNLPLF